MNKIYIKKMKLVIVEEVKKVKVIVKKEDINVIKKDIYYSQTKFIFKIDTKLFPPPPPPLMIYQKA